MQHLTLTPKPFIGRLQEIEEISRLLDDSACRLLSLVGQGGIGKTRLAMEIASQKTNAFPDGVFFVELAPLSNPSDMLLTIAEATPFCFQQDERDIHEQFFDYLRERESKAILLILDNFEHLLDGADIVSEILTVTQRLKILVTSREVLNLEEEWVRQIAGLNYPDNGNSEALEAYGAVQLFMDRARMIRGDLDLHSHQSSIIEICRLVEGMPLAIELATGWLKTLQPSEIARELRQSMDILETRSRNLAERHRSIRSVFSQSWRQMSEDERDAFMKLSVFRGGFTREAAEVIAGAKLFALASLLDKSLIRLGESGRYEIHELLRQYGGEKLEEAAYCEALEAAYVDYYMDLLARLEPEIKSSQQLSALLKIENDFENIRRAWQMAVEQGQFEKLNQACESLQLFGDMRGRYHEGANLLKTAIRQIPQDANEDLRFIQSRLQARLIRLIMFGSIRIDSDVRSQIDACLAMAQARGDQTEIGFCLTVAAVVAIWQADAKRPYLSEEAGILFQKAYPIYLDLQDKFYQGELLAWYACTVCVDDGAPDPEYLKQSLDIRREIGDSNGIAWITLNLTEPTLIAGDYPECERYAREALVLMRELGSVKGILQSMFRLAQMLILKGDLEAAREISEEMQQLAEASNNLDGKMRSAGLKSVLISIMDEAYSEGLVLAQKNYELSLEPFFGGHHDLMTQWGQAIAETGLGNHEVPRGYYATMFWDTYDDPGPAIVCLSLEAVVCASEGDLESSTELLGLAFSQPKWTNGWLQYWPLLQRLMQQLKENLGEEAFQNAWERGARLSLEAAIQLLLAKQTDSKQQNNLKELVENLSERELEVLNLIAEGLSNRDIAERLVLSVGTVKVHTRNIYGKLNVSSRTQALAQAGKYGLL